MKRSSIMTDLKNSFPHFAAGPVVKGFGRGSKELGIPTGETSFAKLPGWRVEKQQFVSHQLVIWSLVFKLFT